MIYPDTITVWRAPLVGHPRGPVRDWPAAIPAVFDQVQVQPLTPTDDAQDPLRDPSPNLDNRRVFSAPGRRIDVEHTDRVEFDGRMFRVIGEPHQRYAPSSGAFHHTEVTIRRIDAAEQPGEAA